MVAPRARRVPGYAPTDSAGHLPTRQGAIAAGLSEVGARLPGMATWQQFETEAPDLAAAVRARFEATKHHVLATLRKDGSPRVSGTEVRVYDGDLTIGSMWQAVKARDLQRDGRYAVHANPGDGSMAGGDAKVAGVAVEVVDEAGLAAYASATGPPDGPFHFFRLGLAEVVLTSVDGDHLVIQTWRPGGPPTRVERT